jgi:cell division protein FtsB
MRRAVAIAVSAATNRAKLEAEAEMEVLRAENSMLSGQVKSAKTG